MALRYNKNCNKIKFIKGIVEGGEVTLVVSTTMSVRSLTEAVYFFTRSGCIDFNSLSPNDYRNMRVDDFESSVSSFINGIKFKTGKEAIAKKLSFREDNDFQSKIEKAGFIVDRINQKGGYQVMEITTENSRFLAEIRRTLKPDGYDYKMATIISDTVRDQVEKDYKSRFTQICKKFGMRVENS